MPTSGSWTSPQYRMMRWSPPPLRRQSESASSRRTRPVARRAEHRVHRGARYSQDGAIAQQLALDDPKRCDRLVLACTFAFNMATPREWLEGHLLPILVRILGTRRLARLVVSQAANQLGK